MINAQSLNGPWKAAADDVTIYDSNGDRVCTVHPASDSEGLCNRLALISIAPELLGIVKLAADRDEMRDRSPLYMDSEGREGIDHVGRAAHHARIAIDKADSLESQLSEAKQSIERMQASIELLGDKLIEATARALRAELALNAVKP